MKRVLVVCVGNICRSPIGEALLRRDLSADFTIGSAGIGAMVGDPADETMAAIGAEHGLSLEAHRGQQFTKALAAKFDLILVMEPGHKREVTKLVPELSGRVMLFDHWEGGKGIADPYRRSREFCEIVFSEISKAASGWTAKLAGKR